MADALPESTLAALDDPFAQLSGPLASTTRLDLRVAESARLTPHMQRLRLTAPELDGFGYLPGQDVMLLVAAEGTRPVRRRYTIRELDAAARCPRSCRRAEPTVPSVRPVRRRAARCRG